MAHKVTVDYAGGHLNPFQNASMWLRKEYGIPETDDIQPHYGKYFGIELFFDVKMNRYVAIFPSESEYALFLWKWT